MSLASSPPLSASSSHNKRSSLSRSSISDPSRVKSSPLRNSWVEGEHEGFQNFRFGGDAQDGEGSAAGAVEADVRGGEEDALGMNSGGAGTSGTPKDASKKRRHRNFFRDLNLSRKSPKKQLDGQDGDQDGQRPIYTHRRGESAVANVAIRAGEHEGSSATASNAGSANGKGQSPSRDSHESTTFASSSGVSRRSHDHDAASYGRPEPHAPAIDPAQIVQMALNLSESRRMQLQPGHLPSPGPPGARKVTAGSINPPRTRDTLSGSYGGKGSSMRQALQEHSKGSRNASPSSGKSRSPARRSSSLFPPFATNAQFDYEPDMQFSPGTLARAQQARQHFELAHHHRRLLECLPPLATSDTNTSSRKSQDHARSTLQSRRGHGDAHQGWGRAYNPLQMVRNRKVRARERDRLEVEADGWSDPTRVGIWVDAVEANAENQKYMNAQGAALPKWHSTHNVQDSASGGLPGQSTPVSASKGPKLPKLEWYFEPQNLLADAYWVEQGSNKALMETRDGHRLFPFFQRVQAHSESPQSRPISHAGTGADDIASPVSFTASKSPDSPREPYTESDDDHLVSAGGSFNPKSKPGRVARLLRRNRATSAASETLFHSDDEGEEGLGRYRKHPRAENVGPLHRHMNQMLENETHYEAHGHHHREPVLEEHGRQRRLGISGEHHESPTDPEKSPIELKERARTGSESSNRASLEETSREPGLDKRRLDPRKTESTASLRIATLDPIREQEALVPNTEPHTSEEAPATSKAPDNTDSSHLTENGWPWHKHDPGSFSADRTPRHKGHKHKLSIETTPSPAHTPPNERKQQDGNKSPASAKAKHLLKGGRLGELVRSEAGGNAKKRTQQEHTSAPSTRQPSINEDSSDNTSTSGDGPKSAGKPTTENKESLAQGFKRHSIATSTRLGDMNTRLPSFKHVESKEERNRRIKDIADSDLSLRQQIAARQRRRSTHTKGADLPVLKVDGVSPNTSSPDLSRYGSGAAGETTGADTRDSSLNRSNSRSSNGVRDADRRLNKILKAPGGFGGNVVLPMTGLSLIEARTKDPSGDCNDPMEWNGDLDDPKKGPHRTGVTHKDVTYITSLLVASGVKAKGIERNANGFRGYFPKFLQETAKLTNSQLKEVPRRQEHIVAARMLSSSLEENVNEFEATAEVFRNQTCAKLYSQVNDLRDTAGQHLTSYVRSCGDDADTFISKLTTTHTLAVKQVNDGIDMLLRSRRARLRWARGSLFKMLEWFVVGLLWIIWLIVLVLRIFRATVMGVYRGTRWLLWLS